jgi:uncharacterized protein
MKNDRLETKTGSVSGERAEDSGALYILGTRYSTGRDVEQDLIAAHKWFNLAAMMGHEEARICRAELAREMSAADIAEAQRQARSWLWDRANTKHADEAVRKAAPITAEAKAKPEDGGDWQGNTRSLCA